MSDALAVQPETHGYRYVCPHGKVRAMTVDDTLTTHRCIRDLADFRKYVAKHGGKLDRVTLQECRDSDFGCDECDCEQRAKRKK